MFQNHTLVQEMLSQANLGAILPLLSDLPHDCTDSVQGFYEALHFLSEQLLPSNSWILECLSSGLLFCNLIGRLYHAQCVRLMLYNFRLVAKHDTPAGATSSVPDRKFITFRSKGLPKTILSKSRASKKPALAFYEEESFFSLKSPEERLLMVLSRPFTQSANDQWIPFKHDQ